MTRELKFRVWNTVLKKYVCPNVVEQKDGLWLNLGNEDNLYEFEQYTGLKDKNGKEIYEGDIVEYDWYIIGEKPAYRVKTVVEFDDLGAVLKYDKDTSFVRDCTGVEVIGNIHENPEWLK